MPSSAFRGALKQRRPFSKSESVAFRMVSQEKETWQEKGKWGKTHYRRYVCTLTALPLLGSQKLGRPAGKLFLSHAIASPSVYRRFCVPYQGSTCSEMKQLNRWAVQIIRVVTDVRDMQALFSCIRKQDFRISWGKK